MARKHSQPLRSIYPYRWALWVFVLTFLATFGFFWMLGHGLKLDRIKDKPAKATATAKVK